MKYDVIFEPFTERHYVRTFAKKYKQAWERTISGLILEFTFVDLLFKKSIAESITDKNADIVICKTEFKIAGTNVSRHASGNRCIIAIHKSENKVCVLFVYGKTDLSSGNETAEWKNVIRENYSEYRKYI